jgi:ADP-heptose:LPS heptosyltransferase
MSPVTPLPSRGRLKRFIKTNLTTTINPTIAFLANMIRQKTYAKQPGCWPFEQAPSKILLVRFDLLGDTALSLPLIFDLKQAFPESSIAFATSPAVSSLVQMCPYIDEVLAFDAPSLTHRQTNWQLSRWREAYEFLTELRTRNFDLAISLYGPLSGTLVGLSGSRWRVGFADEASSKNFDHSVQGGRGPRTRHEIDWVRHLGGQPGAEIPDNLISAGRSVNAWCQDKVGPKGSYTRLVLHTGARTGEAKLWPNQHWHDLVTLLDKHAMLQIIFVGGAAEAGTASALLHNLDKRHLSFAGRTTIPQLASILKTSDLTISADSGPLHLSALMGRPTLGLYGPTDPHLSGPYGIQAHTIVTKLPCHPCYDLRAPAICPFGDSLCMDWIRPLEVHKKIVAILGWDQTDKPL